MVVYLISKLTSDKFLTYFQYLTDTRLHIWVQLLLWLMVLYPVLHDIVHSHFFLISSHMDPPKKKKIQFQLITTSKYIGCNDAQLYKCLETTCKNSFCKSDWMRIITKRNDESKVILIRNNIWKHYSSYYFSNKQVHDDGRRHEKITVWHFERGAACVDCFFNCINIDKVWHFCFKVLVYCQKQSCVLVFWKSFSYFQLVHKGTSLMVLCLKIWLNMKRRDTVFSHRSHQIFDTNCTGYLHKEASECYIYCCYCSL